MYVWFTWGTRKKVFFIGYPKTLTKILASSFNTYSYRKYNLGPKWSSRSTLGLLIDWLIDLLTITKNPQGFHLCANSLGHAGSLIFFCLWQQHLCTADLCECCPPRNRECVCIKQSVDFHDTLFCVIVYELFAFPWPCYVSELSGTQLYFILSVTCVSLCHCCDSIALVMSSVSYSQCLNTQTPDKGNIIAEKEALAWITEILMRTVEVFFW